MKYHFKANDAITSFYDKLIHKNHVFSDRRVAKSLRCLPHANEQILVEEFNSCLQVKRCLEGHLIVGSLPLQRVRSNWRFSNSSTRSVPRLSHTGGRYHARPAYINWICAFRGVPTDRGPAPRSAFLRGFVGVQQGQSLE